jgi:hypothetical protein
MIQRISAYNDALSFASPAAEFRLGGAREMNLWLIHVEPFHRHAIPHLAAAGIRVSYVLTSPERLREMALPAECIGHSRWDALRGRLPQSFESRVPAPVSRALLDDLAPCEATVLLMLDRLNRTLPRIEELRRIYFDYLAMWSRLLEQSPPGAVVFHTMPHEAYDYVLYALCRRAGIRTLIVERTSLPDRLILLESLEDRPHAPAAALDAAARSGTDEVRSGAKVDYLAARNSIFLDRGKERFSAWSLARLSARSIASFCYQFVRRPLQLAQPILATLHGLEEPTPSRARYNWRYMLDTIAMGSLRLYYENRTTEPGADDKYVYFPLHNQPERSSVPMGLPYSDQVLAAHTIAEALPPGWVVYVREHPRQFTDNHMRSLLARSRRFYDRLCSHPRVRLISVRVPADALVARSRCTATVAGSAGWEALAKGIPVAVFGRPWYLHCPGVEKVGSVSECAATFERVARGEFNVDPAKMAAYTRWIAAEGGFRGYPAGLFARQSGLTPEENGRSFAEAFAARLASASQDARAPARATA